ncbi:LysM peptidoglycan-binding domain-containing protein [Devriesea agamarum]|uniref:LysM peptidoglycan-binding domain-containing protein n=1 Tax=Devriesea agamarum TaxID=472569 RepID=UPI00071D7BE7|nr:LysM peptidoglycan-binding domain-containing protein [Devriesea agamarum]
MSPLAVSNQQHACGVGALACGGQRHLFVVRDGSQTPNVSSARPAVSARMRLTTRGRIVVTMLLGAAIVSMLLSLFIVDIPAAMAGGRHPDELAVVMVQPGETLWNLAERYGDDSLTVQDNVRHLREINHLPNEQVSAGTALYVPAG